MVKNKNSNINKNKKPAMALVLIIIIITSLSFVIMGTMRIVTSTHSKYSINKNETGTLNVKKVQGRYICYLYKEEGADNYNLYQQKIVYDKDGKVDADNSDYMSANEPSLGECKFKIPNGVSQLNFTLIGAGSGSVQQYFSKIRYIDEYKPACGEDGSVDLRNEISYECVKKNMKNELSVDGFEFNFDFSCNKPDTTIFEDNLIIGSKDDLEKNIVEYFKEMYPGCDSANPEYKFSTIYLKHLGSGEDIIKKPLLETNLRSFLSFSFEKYIKKEFFGSDFGDRSICAYRPKITLSATILGDPGDVVKFSLPSSYFKDFDDPMAERIVKINKDYIGSCQPNADSGCIGMPTKFEHTFRDSNGNTQEVKQTTSAIRNTTTAEISRDCDGTGFEEKPENGKEAAFVLSNDFQLAQHGFDIHTGYKDERDKYHPATLFGSTAAITDAKANSCIPTPLYSIDSDSYKLATGGNPTVCLPTLRGASETLTYTSVPQKKLSGAPGAIIIEW